MTLHEAIETLIRQRREGVLPSEVAKALNQGEVKGFQSVYEEVSALQVSQRVQKYPNVFSVGAEGKVGVKDLYVKPYKDFVWHAKDILRSRVGPHFNDDVVFALVFAVYNNNKEVEVTSSPKSLYDLLDNCADKFAEQYGIFSYIRNKINKILSDQSKEELIELIMSFDFNPLQKPSQKEFGQFFNELVNQYTWKERAVKAESSTPNSLSALMSGFFEVKRNSKVFDPFAGVAGLMATFYQSQNEKNFKVIAGDINDHTVQIGSLNLLANGIYNFSYKSEDAFIGWNERTGADLFISAPPFGSIPKAQYSESMYPKSHDFSSMAVELASKHLKEDGKGVLLLSESFAFSTKSYTLKLKQYLIENQYLKGIVLLPKGIFKPYAGVGGVVLIIDKEKSSDERIFLYDASDILAKNFHLETERILSAFKDVHKEYQNSKRIFPAEIIKSNFDLSVKRYLDHLEDIPNLVELNTIINQIGNGMNFQSSQIYTDSEGVPGDAVPYIQVKDLRDNISTEPLDIEEVNSYVFTDNMAFPMDKFAPNKSILISRVGTKLKPTLFYGDNFEALCNNNVAFFTLKKTVLPEYVITQLNEEYVTRQLNIIRQGSTILRFSTKDFLKVKIKLIPLEEQRNYVIGYYAQRISAVERVEQENKEAELYNIISRIKHEIEQPLSSINIDIESITDYLKDKDASSTPVTLDDYVIEPLQGQSQLDIDNTKVSVVLSRVLKSVAETKEILGKIVDTLSLGKVQDLVTIELKSFLEDKVAPLYVNAPCMIKIKGKPVYIKGDEEQMKFLFKNFINNAIKHGFQNNKPRWENVVLLRVGKVVEDNFTELLIANNGKPFSEGFDAGTFEARGATTDKNRGAGFGGFHIKKILQNHGGFLEVDKNEVSKEYIEFPVRFKIFLPRIK